MTTKVGLLITALLLLPRIAAPQNGVTSETLNSFVNFISDDLRRGDVESAQIHCIQFQSALTLKIDGSSQVPSSFSKALSARPLGLMKNDPDSTSSLLDISSELASAVASDDNTRIKLQLGRLMLSLSTLRVEMQKEGSSSNVHLSADRDLNDYLTSSSKLMEYLQSGEYTLAEELAPRILARIELYKQSGSLYGENFYSVYDALGRAAFKRGDFVSAQQYLVQAAKTPGSPRLGSFGPNMWLAQGLLDKGYTSTVIDYLNSVKGFWNKPILDQWIAGITSDRSRIKLLPNALPSF